MLIREPRLIRGFLIGITRIILITDYTDEHRLDTMI